MAKPPKQVKDPKQVAKERAQRIAVQLARGAGKGLNAARFFLTSRIKEALSVPAPRRQVVSRKAKGAKGKVKKALTLLGYFYYVATTPASPMAPPRKLSGRLRSSVTSIMMTETTAAIGVNAKGLPSKKYPLGFLYPSYHEIKQPGKPKSGKHPFLMVTFVKWRKAITLIIGHAAAAFLKQRG